MGALAARRREPRVSQPVTRLSTTCSGSSTQVSDEPLDTQIEVSEQVHRVLQGRLADLGQE